MLYVACVYLICTVSVFTLAEGVVVKQLQSIVAMPTGTSKEFVEGAKGLGWTLLLVWCVFVQYIMYCCSY